MLSTPVDSIHVKHAEYDYDVLSADEKILDYYNNALSRDTLPRDRVIALENTLTALKSQKRADGRILMRYKDLEYLHESLKISQGQGNFTVL